METGGGPKDLSHFFAAMLAVQRQLLDILRVKGPKEAAMYVSHLTGGENHNSSPSTVQLSLPSLTDEDDPATFLCLFERAALSAQLPETQWAPVLASLLTGEALAACEGVQGNGDGQLAFQDLKTAVLDRSQLAEESCRVQFRSLQSEGQGLVPRVLAKELLHQASGWLKPHSRSAWEVTQFVVMEQFIALLPEATATWVRMVRPVNLEEAMKLAETHLSLSADTPQGKVGRDTPNIITSEMVPASPERNCPMVPQRIPNKRRRPTKCKGSCVETEAVKLRGLYDQSEILTEGSDTWGSVQQTAQSSATADGLLTTCPPQTHSVLSSLMVEKSQSHGNTNITLRDCEPSSSESGKSGYSSTSNQWGQQRPELSPLGEGEGEGGYVCGMCGKSFLFFKGLQQHQLLHSSQPPFLCVECGLACRSSTGLKRHRAVHSGNRLYPCPDCSESFTYAERLVHHRTVHAALRPHSCPVCHKSFRLKKVLKKHEQVHHRERPPSPRVYV